MRAAGDETPAGGRYRSFGELALDEDGLLLFAAELDGAPAPRGLLLRSSAGDLQAVALADGARATFRRPRPASWPDEGGRRFRLTFVAGQAGGGRALVEWSPGGAMRTLLTTGTAASARCCATWPGGLSNREIADLLHVAETTIRTHVAHVLMKLNLRDRTRAVVLAYESGAVD